MVRGRGQRTARGFTLVELMVVIAMISILVTIALPQIKTSIVKARESVLKEDLYRFRQAIDQYHADKGVYPPTLKTLEEEGYLRRLEADPMTGAADWVEVPSEPDPNAPDEAPGVYDVHSASDQASIGGQAYNEW